MVLRKIKLLLCTLTIKEIAARVCDEYLWSVLKHIPGFSGLYLRYWYISFFASKTEGFVAIQRGVHLTGSYGLELGKNVVINRGCVLGGDGGIKIGSHAALGTNVTLVANSHSLITHGTGDYTARTRRRPITIGAGTILCANVFVDAGVVIGNNVIVSANTAVLSDIPDGQVISSAKLYNYTEVMRSNFRYFKM